MAREEKLLTLFTTAVFPYKLLHAKVNEGKEEYALTSSPNISNMPFNFSVQKL
jgi:hypothetical protein